MSAQTGVLTPKFLTAERAEVVVSAVLEMFFNKKTGLEGAGHNALRLQELMPPKRRQCHVVILVPGMVDHVKEDYPNWPDYPTKAVLLYERSWLDGEDKLREPVDNIARCKALQLWTDRNDGTGRIAPHLLFPGDTPYWGGVKRDGIVVACSGVQKHLDQTVSGVIADLLIGVAQEVMEFDQDVKDKKPFLS